ncbi:hypothetical protein [Chelativorans sp. AA-79]|uniref:hypothetical protein n=1 Tax=Chelativorans sp. AA-79 TaxID=3028735 RepID=UPI0023F7B4ED|nr:hypothetical protein [Chelativorans sp. AA-79]WEX10045.1 hypothetical protein PVE73_03505 [Chelativorans sp. AA-79]
MEQKVPPKKARQGREGFPVLLVLIGGLVLAGIIWALVEVYGIFIDQQQPVEMPQSTDEVPIERPQD